MKPLTKIFCVLASILVLSACTGGSLQLPNLAALGPAVSVTPELEQEYAVALQSMKSRKYEEAIKQLRPIAAQAPELSGPWLNMGIAYRQLGNLEEAEKALDKAVSANSRNPQALNHAGVVKRELGKFSTAERLYKKALSTYPEYADAHLNLAILCDVYLKKIDCAKDHYRAYQQYSDVDNKQVVAWLAELEHRVAAVQ